MTRSLAVALALLVQALFAFAHASQRSQPEHVVLVSENEPGQTLIVRGAVYAPDGVTPVPGLELRVHHTDSMGYYCMPPSPERDRTLPRDNCPDSPPNTARLRATLTTDAQGRFEFHTIKPGSYPNSRNPAHIHFQASGAGFPSQWPHDLNFAGDPYIGDDALAANAKLGKFRFICDPQPVGRGKGIQCKYNIRLEKK